MSEAQPKRGQIAKLAWLIVILAIALIWWHFRSPADPGAATAEINADRIAAATDPDDILVDLRDDTTPAQLTVLERGTGLDLVLVDDTARSHQLYRAHVDPARRDAILASLVSRSEVEIAEPDAEVQLSPHEQELRAPLEPTHEGFPNDPQYKFQWHMRQVGMPEAWKLADGNGVIVAVLDTGVAYENFQTFHMFPTSRASSSSCPTISSTTTSTPMTITATARTSPVRSLRSPTTASASPGSHAT